MTDLRTNEKLLTRLKSDSNRKLTEDELYKQRVSFIMGSLSDNSTVTRAQVTEVLANFEGRKSA
ncbi:hypothetical protein [Shinella zoogloeoides]|uniref:hypothetical protein n=1 Tax=Shinella zoogloeoides TaxID=352475 RepID=UPI001F5855AA|nr:hypothetical protein [Shinella zoogloeoides]